MNRNWWEVLHEGSKQGWLSYKNLASCIPEKTPTLEIRDAINIAKSECEELGLTPKTEKFGECVLSLTN